MFRTEWARRAPGRAAREVAQKAGLEPVFRSQVRTQVEGSTSSSGSRARSSSWPTTPPTSTRPLVLLSLPDEWRRRTAVAAAADYFFDTWWRAVGSALLFNTFPIERRGGSMSDTPGEVLADGWSLLIFPEGTRSPDGWMGRFRMGAAYLACEHGVPVVPIAHRGTFAAMPRGQGWPSPGRRLLTIRFGEPLRARARRVAAQLRAPDQGRRRRAARRGVLDLVGGAAPCRGAARPRTPAARTSPRGAASGSRPPRRRRTAPGSPPGAAEPCPDAVSTRFGSQVPVGTNPHLPLAPKRW